MRLRKIDFIDFESKNVLTKKTWLVLIMVAVVYYSYIMISTLFTIIVAFIQAMNTGADFMSVLDTDSLKLFSLFLTSLGIIISLLYVRFLEKRSLSTTGIVKKGLLKQYAIGYLLGILMIGLPTLATIVFNGNVYVNANANYGLLALYFLGFLIQGASEEIMIRGYLLTTLAKTTNKLWAIILSSVVFALLHIVNPSMGIIPFLNLFLFGVFAALFFLRTKNIWAISAIHSAWNFFQGNVFGIQVSGQIFNESVLNIKSTAPEILSGSDFGLEGGLFVTILLVVATLITVFYGDNKLVAEEDTHEDNVES